METSLIPTRQTQSVQKTPLYVCVPPSCDYPRAFSIQKGHCKDTNFNWITKAFGNFFFVFTSLVDDIWTLSPVHSSVWRRLANINGYSVISFSELCCTTCTCVTWNKLTDNGLSLWNGCAGNGCWQGGLPSGNVYLCSFTSGPLFLLRGPHLKKSDMGFFHGRPAF